jgi:tetratricopeptide (TPR) repeat protein
MKSLAIYEKVLGTDHPSTGQTYNNLGLLYYDQGKYEETEVYFMKSLAISEKVFGTDHPSTKIIKKNLEELKRIHPNGL